jgi:hypothetical protein
VAVLQEASRMSAETAGHWTSFHHRKLSRDIISQYIRKIPKLGNDIRISSLLSVRVLLTMSGSMRDPFRETVADCSFCLDLKKEYLRYQWRQFGPLPAMQAPYSITLGKLAENATSTNCTGCALVLGAAQHIRREFGTQFRNATLEYLDNGRLGGLSLTLTMLYPAHATKEEWEMAMANDDLKVEMATGPSELCPEREWEHRISSPRFEIFSEDTHCKSFSGSYCKTDRQLMIRLASEHRLKRRTDAGENRWTGIQLGEPRCGDTSSDEAVQWSLKNIHRCQKSHPECKFEEPGWTLPTRVIDLGDDSESPGSEVKLYVTNGEQMEYICLSHCWGSLDKKPLETRRDTMDAFQIGIPWGKLTKTFKDAIVFSRKLGVRFLWIDSLCIIQDDSHDWAREAGRMASIYENALLTLAAASSSNSRGGLFRTSNPGTLLPHDENILAGFQADQREIYIRRFPSPTFFEYGAKADGDGTSPLLKRAWVFQERILSRRILFFTPWELVFECRVSNSTESGQSWINSRAKHDFTIAYEPNTSRAELATLWRRVVQEFTHLQLTMEKDTLPAMAGLAKRIQQSQAIDTEYFAGLWRDTFIEDMLWEAALSMSDNPQRVNPSIPSWSWARTDTPKRYNLRPITSHLCDIKDVVYMGDSFVTIYSGYVVLSGFLLQAKATGTGFIIDKNPRVTHVPSKDYPNRTGNDRINEGDILFALPLVVTPSMKKAGEHDADTHGLVIRSCPENPGTFARVGSFWTSLHHLRHQQYILEGNDILLSILKKEIAYGESLLDENGSYRPTDDAPLDSEDFNSGVDTTYTHFKNRAWYLHFLLYGPKNPELDFETFYGLPHLEMLRVEMLVEEERIREWNRRNKWEEKQEHSRSLIKIV